MGTHAPIAPSSLGLTVACNASVMLQQSAPEQPETEEAAEGTAAHLVARAYAEGRAREWPVGHEFESGGRKWTVTLDMANGARLFADALCLPTEGGQIRLEDPVRVTSIHPEHCWGTPDGWRYFPKGLGRQGVPVLRVVDYKFGHSPVEEFENWQLLAYARGVMERLNLPDSPLILELTVVQPRAFDADGPVRVWRVPAEETRAMVNIAWSAAHAALGENPKAQTGPHCKHCKARHVCGTLRTAVAEIVDYSGHADPQPLDDIAVGQELRILDAAANRLEARRTALAIQAETLIRAGKHVPFYELVPGRTSMEWNSTAPVEEIAAMGDLIGISLRKPMAICTPWQAIDAGLDKAVVDLYASRPPAALKLKPVSLTNANKAFGVSKP